jgi:phenylpyruvate tautomerase
VPSGPRIVNEIGPKSELLGSIRSMPLLQIQTSASVDQRQRAEAGAPTARLLKELSALLARELAKPESYVMLSVQYDAALLFGGTDDPACFAALKNIGTFTAAQTEKLSALLCAKLSEALGVAPNRIYIEFVDAKPHLWGYDGATFA